MGRSVTGGDTNVTTYFVMRLAADGTGATGLTITAFALQYVRNGVAPVGPESATALAATDSNHADNKAIEIDATDQPGLYRVDWPDAAFLAGVPEVVLTVKVATCFTEHLAIQINPPVDITVAGATVATPARDAPDGFVVTKGENEANDEDSTHALDAVYHDIEAVNDTGTEKIEVYYEFDVGGDGLPTGVEWIGFLEKGGGAVKNITVNAWNWGTSAWNQVGSITSGVSNSAHAFTLFVAHVGTDVGELGLVRLQFVTGTVAFSATTKLKTDQIFAQYVITGRTVGYSDGAIWVDTVNGTAGTETHVNGTADNPVLTWADALTLSAALGTTDRFHIANGSTVTLSGNSDNYTILGSGYDLALNGQSIVDIYVNGAHVSGVAAGSGVHQVFDQCHFDATSHIAGTHLHECAIMGTQTVIEAGDYFFDRCHSAIAGTATWVFDFGAAIGNTNLNVRNYSGGIQLESMGDTGTDTASIEGQGQIIEGTCTGGTVAVRGMFTVSGFTNLTLSDDARIDVDQINAECDAAIADAALATAAAVAAVDANVSTRSSHSANDVTGGLTVSAAAAGLAAGHAALAAEHAALASEHAALATAVVDKVLTELSTTPPANPTIGQAIMLAYMHLRNNTTTTRSTALLKIRDDAGTVVMKATISDDEDTFGKAGFVNGP